MKKTSNEEGYVVIDSKDDSIYEFTFSGNKRDSINRWVSLWEYPNNWRAHYRSGIRCIKAEKIINLK